MSKSSERRDGPRIDLRLRVRWAVPGTDISGEAEASDVSPKGLRLESEKEVDNGAEMILVIDAGDEEALEAKGKVSWCRPRQSPTGKTMWDLGVAFESEWLAQERGPLGNALARIFAMNSYEPARAFERTPVSLRANTATEATVELSIADISVGGMQLKATSGHVDEAVTTGSTVIVEFEVGGSSVSLDGRVAWVAGEKDETSGRSPVESFGVQFLDVGSDERALLERVRLGQSNPERITVFVQK
jgi:Tfp pilus assembly protein PilZ